jgi:ABC-type transport system involved in cytochrome c biogenesis ATPase subunit
MQESVIRIEGLVKDYGSFRALHGVDLQVDRGEVFGFIGPNGAGKTTTIRILLDLLRPTAGRAEVLGVGDLAAHPELRSRIGYLPGDLSLAGRRTPRQHLHYLCALRQGAGRDRIEGLAERLGLELDRSFRSLSKGNKQKVGIIQAFMERMDWDVMMEAFLSALMEALGYDDMGTAAGYIGSTVYGLVAFALLLVFAVANGSSLIAGREEEGALELELTSPTPRSNVYAQRLAALWLQLAVLVATVTGLILALDPLMGLEIPVGDLASGTLGLWLVAGLFGSIAFAAGAATGRKAIALGTGAAAAVVGWMLNAIAPTAGLDQRTGAAGQAGAASSSSGSASSSSGAVSSSSGAVSSSSGAVSSSSDVTVSSSSGSTMLPGISPRPQARRPTMGSRASQRVSKRTPVGRRGRRRLILASMRPMPRPGR